MFVTSKYLLFVQIESMPNGIDSAARFECRVHQPQEHSARKDPQRTGKDPGVP